MVDTPKTAKDFDNLSDEDFLALDPSDFSGNMVDGNHHLTAEPEEESAHAEPEEEVVDEPDDLESPVESDESTDSESDDTPSTDEPETSKTASKEFDDSSLSDEEFRSQKAPGSERPTEDTEEERSETDAEAGGSERSESVDSEEAPKDTPAKAGFVRLPEGFDNTKAEAAFSFYEVISKPFKADGKEITVRSPEDAIRLMQQGLNYSRRMQELKPTRHLTRMLEDHQLTDQKELSFLIDLKNGNKEAIHKLLKDHNIDVMDIDPDKESVYQAPNYGGTAKLNELRDALDVTMTTPAGQALVTHIHESWDDASKERLREAPEILGNLNELKMSGVYDKVVEELEYQRSIGYLQGIPFLAAFDQVGEAMKNAGVFGSPQPQSQPAPTDTPRNLTPRQPVARGARKDPTPKKVDPAPHLSSTPPSRASSGGQAPEPAYEKMSDEEFLKMAPPE